MTVCHKMLSDIAGEVGDFYKSIKVPLPDGEKIATQDYIQRLLGATYLKDVRKRIDKAVRSLELHMKPDLSLALEILIGLRNQLKKRNSHDMALPNIYEYLHERLSVLKRNLSPMLMKRLCRRLWASCLDVRSKFWVSILILKAWRYWLVFYSPKIVQRSWQRPNWKLVLKCTVYDPALQPPPLTDLLFLSSHSPCFIKTAIARCVGTGFYRLLC